MPIIDATKAGAPGDIMDAQFYGAPGPCAKLDATKAGEILARLLERPASQEAPSARLRWFSEWAAAARPPPSQLKSLCVRATVECDRLYGRNRPERDFSPYFLCATLEELAAILESDTALAPGGLHPAVRQAVDITRRSLSQPLARAQIAEMVGLSPAYFSRLFHRETGRTYAAFLLQARMDEATRLLSTTWLKVYEIAERVGVQSYRHFEVLYKKHTGSSPSAVRRPPKG